MPPWIKVIFLTILPKILGMKIYHDPDDDYAASGRFRQTIFDQNAAAFVGAVTATSKHSQIASTSYNERSTFRC